MYWSFKRFYVYSIFCRKNGHYHYHEDGDNDSLDGSEPRHIDPYIVPRAEGKLSVLDAPILFCDLHVQGITDRIQAQRERYEAKINRKKRQEADYYVSKFGKPSKHK